MTTMPPGLNANLIDRMGREEGLNESEIRDLQVGYARTVRKPLGVFFWICISIIGIYVLTAVFVQFFHLQNPYTAPFTNEWAGPSVAHWFGTDDQGRDIFSRTVWATQSSLALSFAATTIGIVIGGGLGMFAALVRGTFEVILSTVMFIVLAVPGIIILLAISSFWAPISLNKLIILIGLLSAPLFYRVIYASTLSAATREYVMIARVQGASNRRVILRELLPNVAPTAISFYIIGIASIITIFGTLAFLGITQSLNFPTWGSMIYEAAGDFPQSNWLALCPALAVCLFLIALYGAQDRLQTYFSVTESRL